MFLVLSALLVLAATVLLLLGLMSDGGMGLIIGSIACSVGAAIVLAVAVRMARPRHEGAATEPAPLPDQEAEPALVGAGAPAEARADDDRTEVAPAALAAPSSSQKTEWLATDQDEWSGDEWEEGDEVEFPIADYDDLTSAQILPLLPQLYADELDVVEERERSTKSRPEILQRLGELRGDDAASPQARPAAAASAPAPAPTPAPRQQPTSSAAEGWEDEDWFPIEDYDSLTVAQISPLLPELDGDELEVVRDREVSGAGRRTILDQIDQLLGQPGQPQRGAAEQPAKRAPAKRAPAKRAQARKQASAKRAQARKQAPAKRAPAKRAAAKQAAAPAKQAAAAANDDAPYGRGSRRAGGRGRRAPAGFPIKGNEGSRLYHLPGSGPYERTNAEVWFADEAAARRAGFRPAGTQAPTKKAAPKKAAAKKAAPKKAVAKKAAAKKAAKRSAR